MEQIQEYGSFLLIILIVLATTGFAAWKIGTDSAKDKDGWGFPLWFTPSGYFILAWIFGGIQRLNQPISVVGALLAYGLSIFLLFVSRRLPSGLQWHYPIGAAAIILIFFF